MSERVSACDIVDEKGTGSTSIVRTSYALEGFLTCSVPYLQLDVLVINLNGSCSKLNANRQVMLLAESFVCELKQKARFADT